MTRTEHLLTIVMEECNEIAQRASKALRFGLDEVQPDATANPEGFTNSERITNEVADLRGVLNMLGIDDDSPYVHRLADAKRDKVERFLAYSAECGTLTATSRAPHQQEAADAIEGGPK